MFIVKSFIFIFLFSLGLCACSKIEDTFPSTTAPSLNRILVGVHHSYQRHLRVINRHWWIRAQQFHEMFSVATVIQSSLSYYGHRIDVPVVNCSLIDTIEPYRPNKLNFTRSELGGTEFKTRTNKIVYTYFSGVRGQGCWGVVNKKTVYTALVNSHE